MLRRFYYVFLALFLTACSSNKVVTQTEGIADRPVTADEKFSLADIMMGNKFAEQRVWGINPMKDGATYSSIDGGLSPTISVYDFASGNKVETIYDSSIDQIPFSSYSFSDDESKILLTAGSERIYRYSSRGHNYIYDRDKRITIPLSEEAKQIYPKFSPDGKKVAYVRDNNLYVFDIDSRKTKAITTDGKWNYIINGMSDWVYEEELVLTRAFEWSPNSKNIAYYKFDEGHVKQFAFERHRNELYPLPYQFKYPKAGERNAVVTIHNYNLNTGSTTSFRLDEETDLYYPRIVWLPDGKNLAILKLNRHQNQLNILLGDAATGNTREIFSEMNRYYISEDVLDNLHFLADGKGFLWSSEKDGNNHIYWHDMNGDLKKQITKGNWEITTMYGFDEANSTLFYQSNEGSALERGVWSMNINTGAKKKLTPKNGWNTATFTNSYDYFVHNYSTVDQPLVIAVRDRHGKEVRKLESNAELKSELNSMDLPKKEFFNFTAGNGVDLNGWMIKPSNFDVNKKYPVLMFVYGGPGSQTVRNSFNNSNYWWHVYMADKGYIIVSVDNRGTGGRGEEFKKMTYMQLGKYETLDQIAAGRYLAGLDYVDGDRIGIWGWSYGGYMSTNCLFQGNDVFKTAIAVAPVTHWKWYDTIYTERFMRTPQENASGYDSNSPINHVNKMKGSLLLVHGMADDNVHFQNTVELVNALNRAGKHYDFYMYPNKNHGIYGGNTRYHLFEKMTNFILENL